MIKGSIQQEDITIVSIYACNIGVPKYIKQILTNIKGKIDSNTIIVRDFNTPLTSMDRWHIKPNDFIDICITFHRKAEEHTFF